MKNNIDNLIIEEVNNIGLTEEEEEQSLLVSDRGIYLGLSITSILEAGL